MLIKFTKAGLLALSLSLAVAACGSNNTGTGGKGGSNSPGTAGSSGTTGSGGTGGAPTTIEQCGALGTAAAINNCIINLPTDSVGQTVTFTPATGVDYNTCKM